jgi:hypothetical protein
MGNARLSEFPKFPELPGGPPTLAPILIVSNDRRAVHDQFQVESAAAWLLT